MKNKIILSLALATSLVGLNASAVSFNYSSTVGSTISFPGSSQIKFLPGVQNFVVTSGSASGLLGEITGTFTIGAAGLISPVSGTGSFIIHDGATPLTASLTWGDLGVIGTGGLLNVFGTVNLNTITYTGGNADLVALKNAGSAVDVLSFQFTGPVTAANLKTGKYSTSFSGSITAGVPDGGMSLLLLGGALTGLACIRRRMI